MFDKTESTVAVCFFIPLFLSALRLTMNSNNTHEIIVGKNINPQYQNLSREHLQIWNEMERWVRMVDKLAGELEQLGVGSFQLAVLCLVVISELRVSRSMYKFPAYK